MSNETQDDKSSVTFNGIPMSVGDTVTIEFPTKMKQTIINVIGAIFIPITSFLRIIRQGKLGMQNQIWKVLLGLLAMVVELNVLLYFARVAQANLMESGMPVKALLIVMLILGIFVAFLTFEWLVVFVDSVTARFEHVGLHPEQKVRGEISFFYEMQMAAIYALFVFVLIQAFLALSLLIRMYVI